MAICLSLNVLTQLSLNQEEYNPADDKFKTFFIANQQVIDFAIGV